MQYLNVVELLPSLEEMENLLTEISQEPLVEAADVEEELTGQLASLQTTRDDIVTVGMDQGTAMVISEAVEGFLMRNPLREFTFRRSIEGLGVALEEIDEKREGILQRLWKWLISKIQAATQWIQKLFSRDGKGEQVLDSTKAMAEDVKNNRKPDSVNKMNKDPAAADQEARIEPQGEKSGSYEEFVEKHKQYAEGLQAEWARILGKIRENKILSTICVSPESVTSFFSHMEEVQDKTQQVRTYLDQAAAAIRANKPVEELVQGVMAARQNIYKLFGGEDATVMEKIRQSAFTDQTAAQFDDIDYDKLVPIMTGIVNNIPAANAQQRVNELTQLTKAVQSFENIANTNVFKRVDATQRNALLSSMQGLTQDVVKFVSAFTQDWQLALRIYTGVNEFFQQERAFYYKTIAAIQKAATEVFEEGDRKALYDNFKHMGFAMDLTPEDLRRRGVGTESLDDALSALNAALESIDTPHPGEVPAYGNIFTGGGLMAALESEENLEDKPGFLNKLKEWFQRFVNWIRGFFAKKVESEEKKAEIITEKKKEKTEKEEAFAQSQGTTKAQAVTKVRPEVKAVFDAKMKDSIWYMSSQVHSDVIKFADSRKANLYFVLATSEASKALQLMNAIASDQSRLWLGFKAINSPEGLVNLASGQIMSNMDNNFKQLQQILTNVEFSTATLNDVCELIVAASTQQTAVNTGRWRSLNRQIVESTDSIDKILGDIPSYQHPAAIQDAARKLQAAMSACSTMSTMALDTYSMICFPTFINYTAVINEIFEGESVKPSEAEIKLLSLDPRWNPPIKL